MPLKAPAPGFFGRGRSAFFIYGLAIGLLTWAGSSLLQPAKPVPVKAPRTIHVAPYSSVLEAIQSADEHDVIELAAGSYPEKILLKDGVTIRALQPGVAKLMSVKADGVHDAILEGVTVGEGGIAIHSSNVRLAGIESEGDIRFDGISTGSLEGSKVSASIVVKDSASPQMLRNFIDGDIDFDSTGSLKMDSNGVTGQLILRAAPPADLLERNIFSAGKKAIRVVHGSR